MHPPLARRLPLAALVTVAVIAGSLLGVAAPAQAAGRTFTVDTTADTDVNGACTDSSVTDPGSPVSVRAALCAAGNLGGSTLVDIPGGTYALSKGAISFGSTPGTSIDIEGVSNTVLAAGAGQRVLSIDEGMVGGVAVAITGLTISGGTDGTYGGGAIIAGSGYATTADGLTITRTTFTGNTTAGSSANHGGAVQFAGGSLRISSSTFSGNSSGTANGGAVYYQATGATPSETLAITGTRFANNTATPSGGNGGAALAVSDTSGHATMSVTGSSFDSNTATGGSGAFAGGGVWLDGGSLAVTGSTFTANTATSGQGSAIAVSAGTVTGSYDNFTGNSSPAVRATSGSASLTRSWWGCLGGAGATGCDTVSTGAVATPYLTVALDANPQTVVQPAHTSSVTATVTDSTGVTMQAADLGALDGVRLAWSVTGIVDATVSSPSSSLSGGTTSTVVTSFHPGQATVTATAGGTTTTTVAFAAAPSFTSGTLATGVVGAPGTFAVTTEGYPVPVLTLEGGLPTGVAFTDNGNGTATIAGTPTGAAADYPVTVVATNDGGVTRQQLTYALYASPAFSSTAATTFQAGSGGTFAITTTGRPAADPISLTGALPAGVTFTDHHDGTATLAGTPAAGTGGIYPLVFDASNGKGSPAQQSFTLTVLEAPVFTSGWETAVTIGDAATVPITTAHAYPAPAITAGATLPAGLTLVDNHDGTATISGTPTGPGQTLTIPLTADNGVTTAATGSLVVTVRERPAITLALADQRTVVGATASFTAAASGYPAPAVAWWVSADNGASWTAVSGGASGTLAFTAARADDGHRYRATFTNAAGSVSTDAVLSVGTTPAFSSAAGASFPADGAAHSFSVTTSGLPSATLTVSGSLPAWLTFTDGGDGTGTLTGTPPAGSGGVYPLTLTAANGYLPDATQAFVLTVTEPVTITSADATTFATGSTGSFTVTTTGGNPSPASLAIVGTLPAGVSFVDRGDGTGTLSGTPAAGSGGVYALQVTADNGATTTQPFTLTVTEAATFSSAASLTVERGVDVGFSVTTGHAYPAVSALSLVGNLPAGLTFTSTGATASIAGSTLDAAGTVTVTVVASAPGVPDTTQTLTITVADVPVALLPLTPPAGDGPVAGVPASPQTGQPITLEADGFAVDSPVTFGLYSSPVVLAVENADATGTARATVILPAGYTGAHSLVALGTAPDGSVRALRTDIVLPGATGGSTGGSGGSGTATGATGGSGLADTGLDAGGLALLALLLLGAGATVIARRRVRA